MNILSDELQAELATTVLDAESRYIEVIIDQDIRKNRVEATPEIEETAQPKAESNRKNITNAKRKLDLAINQEDMAEANLNRYNELLAGATDVRGNCLPLVVLINQLLS